MKDNFQRERSYFHLKRYKLKEFQKYNNRNEFHSKSKSLERLSELNLDIEKLYKKYAEVKKERLMKEKTQKILVNRLKVLYSKQNSSKNKNNLRNSEKVKKIHVKINSKYKNNNITLLNGIKRNRVLETRNNYRTITGNESRKENIINNINTNSNINGSENKMKRSFIQNNYINDIDDILKKCKYNIGNKNSNNNIYIIINNPNNFNNNNEKKDESDNKTSKDNKDNDSKNLNKEEDNIKNGINNYKELDGKGEKIIFMNVEGRKIEDIIKSINNINNKNENKEEKSKDANDKKQILNEKDSGLEPTSNKTYLIKDEFTKNMKENIENKNINVLNLDKKENENECKHIIEEKNENQEKEDLENKKIIIEENRNNLDNNNIDFVENDKNMNKLNENEENVNDKNEEKNKDIEIINNDEEKDDNYNKEFIRPNFLELYKNEDSDISKQKTDINLKDKNHVNVNSDNKIINNDSNKKEVNTIKNEKYIQIIPNKNNSQKNISEENNDTNLILKSPEDTKANNQIPVLINENNKLNEKIYTDDRSQNKKLIEENLYTPKKIGKPNRMKVNKKIDKSLTNQRSKNSEALIKNKKFQSQNNYYMNYSLSYVNLNSNRSSISSNKNNYRKKSYCNSIDKKRKALGLKFKPNIEKELTIQSDKKRVDRKIKIKFNNFKIIKKNTHDNPINKNKVIKVNKRDETYLLNANMEGINATPQRLRICKKNIDNKNRYIFLKNKTATNFGCIKNGINSNIHNNLNDLKASTNLRRINKIHQNYSLSENNNNSSSQFNESNVNSMINNTINYI